MQNIKYPRLPGVLTGIILCAGLAIAPAVAAVDQPEVAPTHPVPRLGDAPAAKSAAALPMAERLRLSAMIGDGPKMLIGIVDATTSNAFLVRLGDTLFGYEVVKADYKAETILMRKDREEITLRLKEDTNAVPYVAARREEKRTDLLPYMRRSKTLEEFLAEHPNAKMADETNFQFPTNSTQVRTFEDFIKEHPELAGTTNFVADGLGSGIEAARPPGITNDMRAPDPGKYGLGPGIEKALMELPPDQRPKLEDLAPGKVKTFEEFIKENEWRVKEQSSDGKTPGTPEKSDGK